MLKVTEIFHSIQGESTHAGRPCVFVRLTGCPLRCTWCDTAYAFYGGRDLTENDVIEQVRAFGCPLVEVTGGEPLSQPEACSLLARLCDEGFEVLLETSGAIDTAGVDRRVRVVLDVKCPGSGMVERMHWPNLERLASQDEVKFVIKDRGDYEWARDLIRRRDLTARCTVLVSPVFGETDPRQLAEWVLADRLPVRFQLQLHKHVWAPDMRGV
ncbi:MAG TPA: 7-carboxy-7-deazaguanine synthase QueE [Nitrospira sp.]|jgi:7-carboxy-7-deazaguanine synthase|nr:7-carboxy-7-deazaguanine synthase QueE [Nitrospira sp.]MBS0175953.1 7-carboxy-7-deazaguanine synthase QueE [Nitrospira sp.]MBX3337389.1 7-carboxy-7-deazaguanine synthase QueE [Nitrospira sp.]MCW5777920.1 7-carboxy-7-deazaguanine synthase QueE [Nitrospira sp.]HNA26092.1 7-carboxy-7-deazaguanine synthase QueE [Nitrospira sp.]